MPNRRKCLVFSLCVHAIIHQLKNCKWITFSSKVCRMESLGFDHLDDEVVCFKYFQWFPICETNFLFSFVSQICKYLLIWCCIFKNVKNWLIVRSRRSPKKWVTATSRIFHFLLVNFSKKIFENLFHKWGTTWEYIKLTTRSRKSKTYFVTNHCFLPDDWLQDVMKHCVVEQWISTFH